MASLKDALGRAASNGIISAAQVAPLADHLIGLGFGRPQDIADAADAGLAAARDSDAFTPSEDSEAPRFVRGFHDVLITVGIVVSLSALAALASVLALIPAVIVLAEILVRRQRLALPAFALTVAYVAAIVSVVFMAFGGSGSDGTLAQIVAFYAASAAGLLPFYWRYRVPVSLAALILAGIGLTYFVLVQAAGVDTLQDTMTSGAARVVAFVIALLSFAVAMWFDLRDRLRVTRRSDVAFWLHLGTAPALLNSALALCLWQTEPGAFWMQSLDGAQAVIALAILAIFMLIGVIIDRRAFVTAGILSLGYALSVILKDIRIGSPDLQTENLFALSALAVGIIILALGIGWQPIRARVLDMLPAAIRDRVPPVRS